MARNSAERSRRTREAAEQLAEAKRDTGERVAAVVGELPDTSLSRWRFCCICEGRGERVAAVATINGADFCADHRPPKRAKRETAPRVSAYEREVRA